LQGRVFVPAGELSGPLPGDPLVVRAREGIRHPDDVAHPSHASPSSTSAAGFPAEID